MGDIDNNDIRRLDGGLLLIFRELLLQRRATSVAEKLGLSQSAISHALKRLRDIFNDPLFIRRPHGLEPTKRAIELGPQVETLIILAFRWFLRWYMGDRRRFWLSGKSFLRIGLLWRPQLRFRQDPTEP